MNGRKAGESTRGRCDVNDTIVTFPKSKVGGRKLERLIAVVIGIEDKDRRASL